MLSLLLSPQIETKNDEEKLIYSFHEGWNELETKSLVCTVIITITVLWYSTEVLRQSMHIPCVSIPFIKPEQPQGGWEKVRGVLLTKIKLHKMMIVSCRENRQGKQRGEFKPLFVSVLETVRFCRWVCIYWTSLCVVCVWVADQFVLGFRLRPYLCMHQQERKVAAATKFPSIAPSALVLCMRVSVHVCVRSHSSPLTCRLPDRKWHSAL